MSVAGAVPVSYTHLDVYKRQDLTCWHFESVKAHAAISLQRRKLIEQFALRRGENLASPLKQPQHRMVCYCVTRGQHYGITVPPAHVSHAQMNVHQGKVANLSNPFRGKKAKLFQRDAEMRQDRFRFSGRIWP